MNHQVSHVINVSYAIGCCIFSVDVMLLLLLCLLSLCNVNLHHFVSCLCIWFYVLMLDFSITVVNFLLNMLYTVHLRLISISSD